MVRIVAALLIGSLFGAGLAVSGMMNPGKVIGFLDVAGNWDPTLAVVMAAALAISAPGFHLTYRRSAPLLAGSFRNPAPAAIDVRLIGGAILFGIGWGIAGFCPGPAIAALSAGLWEVALFFVAMLAGMAVYARVAAGRESGEPGT